jgi:hypothetical protein
MMADDITSDQDLIDEVGDEKLERAGFKVAERDRFRQKSIEDFLDALTRRSPPIFESDIAVRAELKKGVVYQALELMFRQAKSSNEDMFGELEKDMRREASTQFARSITVSTGATGPSGGGFRWERR